MDIAFTIVVWLGLVALTAYGLRLVSLLEEPTDSSDDLVTAPQAERDRVLVG